MKTKEIYNHFLKSAGVCTDTRKIQKNCIFFALKGERFNGNKYVEDALDKGALFAVADEKNAIINDKVIYVDNSLKTLQDIALMHRNKSKAKIIGITGSNGKTTTKELIYHVLKTSYNTIATEGNLNNHIGVPLTLLRISPDTEIAIIEMGANHKGEIQELCEIAVPDEGIITNVGNAHLEGFGSFEGVKEGKSELYKSLKKSNGLSFINADNKHLAEMIGNQKTVKYSFEADADCEADVFTENNYIGLKWNCGDINGKTLSNLNGSYNAENILAAICIGVYQSVQASEIDKAISTYIPSNQRSEIKITEKNKLFLDLYNANPSSMKLALDDFISGKPEEMVILGDMKELGDFSEEKHAEILNILSLKGLKSVFLAGEEFYKHKDAFEFSFFRNTVELLDEIKKIKPADKHIFIKGSRSMRLERLTDFL